MFQTHLISLNHTGSVEAPFAVFVLFTVFIQRQDVVAKTAAM